MASGNGSGLSKSLLLKGLQCPKALWLTQASAGLRTAAAAGPGGPLPGRDRGPVSWPSSFFPAAWKSLTRGCPYPPQLARTRELIDSGTEVIYEASFSFSAIFVKADILVRDGAAWQIYEVKMGTGVKPVNLDDVAVTALRSERLRSCGSARRTWFTSTTATCARVRSRWTSCFTVRRSAAKLPARQQSLPEIVTDLRATLRGTNEPTIDIGPQCYDPYECDFIPFIAGSIFRTTRCFDPARQRRKQVRLYRRGIVHFEDIPLDELNPVQRQQVETTLQQRDPAQPGRAARVPLPISGTRSATSISKPSATPIPRFDGVRPYQQVPFQFFPASTGRPRHGAGTRRIPGPTACRSTPGTGRTAACRNSGRGLHPDLQPEFRKRGSHRPGSTFSPTWLRPSSNGSATCAT